MQARDRPRLSGRGADWAFCHEEKGYRLDLSPVLIATMPCWMVEATVSNLLEFHKISVGSVLRCAIIDLGRELLSVHRASGVFAAA